MDLNVKIIRPTAKNKKAFDGMGQLKKQLDPQGVQPNHLERMCWYTHLFNIERKKIKYPKRLKSWITE